MIVVCKECGTGFNLEDGRIKPSGSKVRCSRCNNVFMVFPPFDAPAMEPPAAEKIFEEPAVEKIFEEPVEESLKEESSLSDEEFDLSEFDKMFDEKVPVTENAAESKDGEAELSDTEDMDFSDLEKMLEIDVREKMTEKKLDESASGDTGELDLSELEKIINNLEEGGVEEEEGEPEELKFDIEPVQDEIVSKIDDEEEVDFSDLEKMLETDSAEPIQKQEESDLKFDLGLEPSGNKDEADEVEDLDLSDLDRIISSVDESAPAGAVEKEPEESLDLDFSDFESVLADESRGVEKAGEKEQDIELKFDSIPEEAGTSEEKPDDLDLDFSEVEKMLEMEGKADLPVQKIAEESLELELVAEDQPEKPQQVDEWADTVVTGKEGLGLAEEEPEEAHPHLEEHEIGAFRNTMEESEAAVDSAESGEKTAEPEKERKPLKTGKPSGKFLSILAIVVIIAAAAAAFVVYNPFGIEIPFVSDFLGSKADEKGSLRIIPLDDSIKGDFVQTQRGNLFVITGKVKNEYKHPRSFISVTGKLFKKGKVLLKAEVVYCGNVIPANDILSSDPALMKKRLQNRLGDKKSNVKVQPGSTVPFMIIFEKVTDELDEFSVEAVSSIKE